MGEGCSCSAWFTIFNLSDANGRDRCFAMLCGRCISHKDVSRTVKYAETRRVYIFGRFLVHSAGFVRCGDCVDH